MTITARVHNHTIALPADVEIAEGAEVQVIVPEKSPPKCDTPDWLRKAVGTATSGLSTDEIMRGTRGEPMKRIVSIAVMLMLLVPGAAAAESGYTVQFPSVYLTGVLDFYAKLTGRKIWLDLSVYGTVGVQSDPKKRLTKEDAIALIRTTLLEKHGIEMREPNEKETFVTWSDDPKYKEIIEATKKAVMAPPPPDQPVQRRVRVIPKASPDGNQ